MEKDSDPSPFLIPFKGQACNDLGGRDEGKILLPPVPCLLTSEAEAAVKGFDCCCRIETMGLIKKITPNDN
ncbi:MULTISPECIES: hypothetical protein [unclassified Microcoleus]|uniref:hypothetical protein n=1 Tax=unclassified Microcoleus TaxID=2642155 RepID=UPI002FD005CC